jgi:hypothetical protein
VCIYIVTHYFNKINVVFNKNNNFKIQSRDKLRFNGSQKHSKNNFFELNQEKNTPP